MDAGFAQVERVANWPPLLLVIAIVGVLVLPVLALRIVLGDALLGFPYLLFAIIVLFFSFGPRDIAEEVDEYCAALSSGDSEQVRATGKALLEREPSAEQAGSASRIEEAVCIQGNNRLFAVVFWFVVFGPLGAWTYRVTDLIRRRAVFRAALDPSGRTPPALLLGAAENLHGWLAWIPARLTSAGYAMAGDFEGAINAWRASSHQAGLRSHELSERLLASVGVGALALHDIADESDEARGIRSATAAKQLVLRALFIWAAVVAAMTLYGWSV